MVRLQREAPLDVMVWVLVVPLKTTVEELAVMVLPERVVQLPPMVICSVFEQINEPYIYTSLEIVRS